MKSKSETQISSDHERKKVFRCEICGKTYTTKTILTQHIGVIHEGNKPFKCDICDYRSSQKGHIKSHVASVHEGKNPSNVTFVTTAVLKRVL